MILENIEIFLEIQRENSVRKNPNLMTQNYIQLSMEMNFL
jgi:hypothetical protein